MGLLLSRGTHLLGRLGQVRNMSSGQVGALVFLLLVVRSVVVILEQSLFRLCSPFRLCFRSRLRLPSRSRLRSCSRSRLRYRSRLRLRSRCRLRSRSRSRLRWRFRKCC